MVDPWEAFQNYQRTAVVLDHFNYEINTVLGGVYTQDGEHRDVRIMLLAGSDLISTMSEPGVWSHNDVSICLAFKSFPRVLQADVLIFFQLDHILGRYGTFVIERSGSGMDQATDSLARWRNNIYPIPQLIQNDVSSTKVRLFFRRGLSVQYLLPAAVITYIEQNNLYPDDGPGPEKDKDKGKDTDRENGDSDSSSESKNARAAQSTSGMERTIYSIPGSHR